MKKFLTFTICFILLLSLLGTINVLAATATLTGTTSVRAGDTIYLVLKAQGSGFYGFEGNINYNTSQLTLSSVTTSLQGWKVELNGSKFVLYDDALAKPTSGTPTILNISFKVKSSLPTGTSISTSVSNLLATDGSKETNFGTVTYETKILAPKSNDATLKSLTVSNAELSPAFKADVISYNATVPFSVTQLNITTATTNSAASYKINGNTLSVGDNTVSIVVTAESGAQKTYTLNIKREQDPNYVASDNADLSSISLSSGILSPVFTKDKTEYIIYLPYETDKITISGTVDDSKAQGVSNETVTLQVGNNDAVVTCTAEDGTEKEYKITVVRMPQFNTETSQPEESISDESEPQESEPDVSVVNESESESSENVSVVQESEISVTVVESDGTNGIPIYVFIISIIIAIGLGGFIGIKIKK